DRRAPRAADQSGQVKDVRRDLHAREPGVHHRGNGAGQCTAACVILQVDVISGQGRRQSAVPLDLFERVPRAAPRTRRSQSTDGVLITSATSRLLVLSFSLVLIVGVHLHSLAGYRYEDVVVLAVGGNRVSRPRGN